MNAALVSLLAVACLAVVPGLADPFLLPKKAFFLVGATALLAFLAWRRRRLEIASLEKAFVVIALLQVIFGLAELVVLRSPFRYEGFALRLKFIGTFGNPEYVAMYLAMASTLVIFHPLFEGPWRRWATPALLLGLALCGSQGIALALAVTCLRRYKGIALGALSLVALSGLHWHTLNGRFLLWRTAGEMFLRSAPFGVGFGEFENHFLETQRLVLAKPAWAAFAANAAFAERAHNEYLDFLAEGGVLALAILCLAAVVAMRAAKRHRNDREKSAWAAVLLCSALCAVVSFPWHLLPTLLFSLYAYAQLVDRTEVELSLPPRFARIFFTGLFVVTSASAVVSLATTFYTERAQVAADAGRWNEARAAVLRGRRLAPRDPALLLTDARLSYRDFRLTESLRLLQELRTIGWRVDGLKLEGLVLRELNRLSEAEAVYRELREALPWNVTSRFYLGEIRWRRGDAAGARANFEETLRLRAVNRKAKLDQARARDFLARMDSGFCREAPCR